MGSSPVIDKFLETLYDDRAIAKAKTLPDTAAFTDENDKPLPEFGELELTWPMKLEIAKLSIRWHQSLEKTLLRIIMVGTRRMIKNHEKEV